MNFTKHLLAATMVAGLMTAVQAAEPLKIGMILPMSGPFADYGKQIEHGAKPRAEHALAEPA